MKPGAILLALTALSVWIVVGVAVYGRSTDYIDSPVFDYLRGAADMKAKILTEVAGPGSSAHTCFYIVSNTELPEAPRAE